jgi:hypothetical protein
MHVMYAEDNDQIKTELINFRSFILALNLRIINRFT